MTGKEQGRSKTQKKKNLLNSGGKEKDESPTESLSLLNRKLTRRQALSTAGKAAIGVGAAVVIGGGAYAAYVASQPSTSTTTSSTTTTTTSSTSSTSTTTTPSTTSSSSSSSSSSSGKQIKLALVSFALSDPSAAAWRDGWVAACNALGAQPLVADYGFDASKTLEDVRNYAAAGVDAIWVQAPTNDIIQSMADAAEANKVYLGWIWNYLPDHFPWNYGSGKYVIINKDLDGIFDHTVSARSVFQTMKNAGHESGKCFVISGREGQATSNIRDYAVQQEWQKNYPNVDLRGFLFGEWSIEPAITATNQILAKQGTPSGAIGANDAIAIGMLRALDAQNIKVPAAGSDAQLPALQLLQTDKASSVIIDAGFNLAYDGGVTAAMLYDIAKGVWQPTEDDRLQVQGMIGIAYDVNAAKTLLGDVATSSFRPYPWFPVSDYVTQVVNKPPGPWNWQAMSMAKADELHITFDRTGGGYFGSNVYTAKQIYGSTDKWNQLYKDQSPKTPADYWGTRANNG